jgi:transposase
MNSIGVDLHKQIITVCVISDESEIVARKTLYCNKPDDIVAFLKQFQPFQLVVEATASYYWFVGLVEKIAEKIVLANPNKLRIIAESTRKTDRLDAQILAEFLAMDMIPQACCGGLWSKRPGASLAAVRSGSGSSSALPNAPRASERSWRSRGNCCA